MSEITHLDRIGIPVFSAVVPESCEAISIYNGKGISIKAARAGALMEAGEPQVAARSSFDGSTFHGARAIDDLIGNSSSGVLITLLSAVLAARGRRQFSSNGLAAGNNIAEATYHALVETIERHVWSVVHAIAHLRPNAIVSQFLGRRISVPGLVDDDVAMELSTPSGSKVVDGLISRICAAGMRVIIRAVELRPFPMLFIATIVEPGSTISASHSGMGCSLSPEHAAIRAITEAAQGRASDMQASREDLLKCDDPCPTGYSDHNRRRTTLPFGRWFFDAPARPVSMASLHDESSMDVAIDIDILLTMLKDAGIVRAVVIDLSPPDAPVCVVRVVVPGLESSVIDQSIGSTIASILDPTMTPAILNQITY